MFDLNEPDGVLTEINECRATFPHHYVRVLAYDASLGRQTDGDVLPGAEPGLGARPPADPHRGPGPHAALRAHAVRDATSPGERY